MGRESRGPSRPGGPVLFTVVNLGCAIIFTVLVVIGATQPDEPFQRVPNVFGAVLLVPLLPYAAFELRLLLRPSPTLTQGLGVANLMAAALVVFAVVSNVGESVEQGRELTSGFTFWFAAIGAAVAAYLTAAGCLRVRAGERRRSDEDSAPA